jgi:serine/threonine-protein kinase
MFETLGQYKILERIGTGDMGEVFRARDTHHGRTVAVQVIVPGVAADPDQRARLIDDARIASALSHPNIAILYECAEDQGQLFLVYEHVPGSTLKRTIGGAPLNPRRAVDLAIQIADALADGHAAGLVHSNLTSETVMVTPKGNAKVVDFGLAAWVTRDAEPNREPVADARPEQARGDAVDHRRDIFAFGAVMFEMLTGSPPIAFPVPAPSEKNRSLPVELDAIVNRAVAPDPNQRYESAATIAAELRSVGALLDARSEAEEAAAPIVPTRTGRTSTTRWIWWLLGLAALVALGWYARGYIA